jgi:hypothetical protein
MMSLPFFALFAGLLLGWAGQRRLALLLWAVSLGGTLMLIRAHITDPLPLDF